MDTSKTCEAFNGIHEGAMMTGLEAAFVGLVIVGITVAIMIIAINL